MTADKISSILVNEEPVTSPSQVGWRRAEIVVLLSGKHANMYPIKVGHIRVYKDSKLFNAVVKAIER